MPAHLHWPVHALLLQPCPSLLLFPAMLPGECETSNDVLLATQSQLVLTLP